MQSPLELLEYDLKLPPHLPCTQRAGREQRKRQATPDWQVADLTSKGTRRFVLGSRRVRSSHPPARILKVYIQALIRLSNVFSPDDLNNTLLSPDYVFENGSYCGEVGRTYSPRTGEGLRRLCWGCRSTKGHILLMTSFNSNKSVLF